MTSNTEKSRVALQRINGRSEYTDEKGRTVSGYAQISRKSLGFFSVDGYIASGDPAEYAVEIFEKIDGRRFCLAPQQAFFATFAEAQAHAVRGLAAQARKHAAKFGAK